MSRASEITLFLILLQASIGFVDATGMFDAHYLGDVSNNATYTIENLNKYPAIQDQDAFDEVRIYAQWAIEALVIGIKIVFTVLIVFPMLVGKFHIPLILSLFIQAGIYYVYAAFYAQYKSGKPWGMIREI